MPKKASTAAPDRSALPYRPCAGVMLINGEGKLFGGKRLDNPGNAWQMPQGGIDYGELPEEAALRELREETGIASDKVEVVAQSTEWLRYDLPDELLGRVWKGKYRGQEQLWFAMRFLGCDADIDIATKDPEFSEWRWMLPGDLIRHIVPFKQSLYEAVFEEFAQLLK